MEVTKMTKKYAKEISNWTYPAPYEMYNMKATKEEVKELMNGLHVAVLDQGEPAGFGAFGWSAQVVCPESADVYQDETYTDVAYGLKPELCDKGLGKLLVKCVNDYVKSLFPEDGLRLTVCKDNIRAVKVYESLGYKPCFTFSNEGKDFIIMIL